MYPATRSGWQDNNGRVPLAAMLPGMMRQRNEWRHNKRTLDAQQSHLHEQRSSEDWFVGVEIDAKIRY